MIGLVVAGRNEMKWKTSKLPQKSGHERERRYRFGRSIGPDARTDRPLKRERKMKMSRRVWAGLGAHLQSGQEAGQSDGDRRVRNHIEQFHFELKSANLGENRWRRIVEQTERTSVRL